jgi:glycosyltransferase involved in cell wall biosynthesis
LTNADLLCHPCEYEGLSKIIIESMMLGLPVLASDVAPIPDYIDDGSTGFLVGNTPKDWAEKLTFIYNNQDRLNGVSRAAQEFSRSTYDIERNAGNYERNFLRLCGVGRTSEPTEPLDETLG